MDTSKPNDIKTVRVAEGQGPKDTKRQKVREWRWWKTNPEKLLKLEHAFAIGCTDKEACGYAGLSENQLYYYEKMHPEFQSRKQVLKDTIILKARETVAKRVGESYSNAVDLLKRKRKEEYGDNLDVTSDGEKLLPAENVLRFARFREDDEQDDHADETSTDTDSK